MGDPPDGPPVVPFPERLDRRLRLGPFASARDALKFLTYAAGGALLAPFTTPYLWPAVVVLGFAICVVRPDGQGLDERAVAFTLWKLRGSRTGGRVTRPTPSPPGRHGVVAIGAGRYAAILQTGGTPIAYLPPGELKQRFDIFRELLRSVETDLGCLVASVPMRPAGVTPKPTGIGASDGPASKGYAELVVLLCRQRSVRRVYLVLVSEKAGAAGISDLENRATTLADRLVGLGLRVTRLRDRSLAGAAHRWGWSWGRVGR
jgi:hypothetical protein